MHSCNSFDWSQQQEAWIATGCDVDACRTEEEEAREHAALAPAPAPADPCLSSFVDMSEICTPSVTALNHGGIGGTADVDNSGKTDAGTAPRPQLATTAPTPPVLVPEPLTEKKGSYDVAYPDRGTVISRYKEKRKNRR
jgi:hypothetical protein